MAMQDATKRAPGAAKTAFAVQEARADDGGRLLGVGRCARRAKAGACRMAEEARRLPALLGERSMRALWCVRGRSAAARGQGTTEYAILVGVLVVIANLAITVFRPKIQELWDAIANGINGL